MAKEEPDRIGMAREEARDRIIGLGTWLIDNAAWLTREMDRMAVEERGITVNADLSPDGIANVRVVKNYVMINR